MESVDNIRNRCAEIISHPVEEVINKPSWGELNFEDARMAFELIYSIAGDLINHPIEKLPTPILTAFENASIEAFNVIKAVRLFSITSHSNPAQMKAELVNQANNAAHSLYSYCHPHISYLALKSDKIEQYLEKINSVQNEAEAALTDIEAKKLKVDNIVSTAQTVVAEIGIEKHTAEYHLEATNQELAAKTWLGVTVAFAAATLVFAACFFFFTDSPANGIELIHKTTSKFFILGTFLFATVWSGRLYRAALHLKISYKQKDLALKTFSTFIDAASDNETKSAVLLEVTKTIFSSTNTGYVDESSKSSDGGVKIVEVVRNGVQTAAAIAK